MNKVSRQESRRRCYVIDDQEASKMYQALTLFLGAGQVQIELKCSDGLSRHMTAIEEFLAYENAPNKQILGVRFSGSTSPPYRYLAMTFDNDFVAPNVFINFDGPPEYGEALNTALEERLESMKPAYAGIAWWGLGVLPSVFPMAEFAIGQGKKRYEQRRLIRTAVLLAFVVAVIAGVAVSHFYA